MNRMKRFRHKLTGRVEAFPDTEYYRDHPQLELVEDEEGCVDCVVQTEVLTIVPQRERKAKSGK